MPSFEQNTTKMILHREQLLKHINRLWGTISGDNTKIASVIGDAHSYSEEKAWNLVNDIVGVYNGYPPVDDMRDAPSLDAFLEGWFTSFGREDFDFEKDRGKHLDETQETLMKSMIYCLMRLIAHGPLVKYNFYSGGGTFADLKRECGVLLRSFSHCVEKERFWQKDIEKYVRCGSCPTSYMRFVDDIVYEGYGDCNGAMLTLGANEFSELYSNNPTFFLDDLDAVYEIFSGKHIAETIPKRNREKILESTDFSYLKNSVRAGSLSASAAHAAFQHGWIDEDDLEACVKHESEQADKERADQEQGMVDWNWEVFKTGAENDVTTRLDSFPNKATWCKRYLALRKAYFKLGGVGPEKRTSDNSAQRNDGHTINANYLDGAIDTVLEQRGVALWSNDAVYAQACDDVLRTTSRISRVVKRGR